MKKISIENTYFQTWALLVGIAIGIAIMFTAFPDALLRLYPYKNSLIWTLLIKLPALLFLTLGGFLLLSFIMLFIKEKLELTTKLRISSMVGVPMLLGLWAGSRECDLFLDNGGSEKAAIEIKELGTYVVAPHEFRKITIPRAPLTIITDGNDTTTFTPENTRYLYNYKQYNVYEIEELTYASKSESQKFVFSGPIRKIKSTHFEKLFSFHTDFILEAPSEISVSKNTRESTRTVLLRTNTQ